MNITRSQSIALGLGTLLLFFAGSVIMLKQNQQIPIAQEEKAPVEEARGSLSPTDLQSAVTLNKFERSESRDGKQLWQVRANKGRYLPQSNSAELEEANMFFFKKDGTQIELRAQKATLRLNGTALTGAEATEGIELIFNEKTRVLADSAVYNREKNMVHVPGDVKILSDNMQVFGRVLDANLEDHQFEISENVSTIIPPQNNR